LKLWLVSQRLGSEQRVYWGVYLYFERLTMSQITLYLDENTAAAVRRAAESEGVSQSQWVSRLIRERTRSEWPESVKVLAGAWTDIPLADEIRTGCGQDIEREPF
jgi:hypothetical protein